MKKITPEQDIAIYVDVYVKKWFTEKKDQEEARLVIATVFVEAQKMACKEMKDFSSQLSVRKLF